MMQMMTQFASAEATSTNPVEVLGINGSLLAFQIVAFAILVFALSKWVYPVFMRSVDARHALIEESTRAAVDAEKHATEAQAAVDKLLREARVQAREIVATAKEESVAMLTDADTKSKQQAEHLIATARESIDTQVRAAKKDLHNETIELVALATEKVVGNVVTQSVDTKVITAALKDVN
ncbi:ATP synthase F0 subunit B [Candidatus Saccharibacteria bacterium]|nr:ATP synthase F0 subunit B [Candidatus Saccharibacteria bacterium]